MKVKWKLTIWFAAVLILISACAMLALQAVSKDILIQDQNTNIQVALKEFSKKVFFSNSEIQISPGAHFYERGVYRIVYDSDGSILYGSLPEALVDIPISFHKNSVREHSSAEKYYLEYDIPLTFEDNVYWIKGVAPLDDEMKIISSILQRSAILIVSLASVSVICAYIILQRVFVPVEKIRKTAEKIAQSNDLSGRIRIGRKKDEIHALANTFDEMLDKIEQTLLRERQFSADVSHELRTPIAVILSECDYAMSFCKTAQEYTDSITVVNRQAKRMQKLVTELLTLSKMETHTIQTDLEVTDISELLSFVCDEQEEIQNPDIVLKRHIAPGIVAKADRELLARLFINLIGNAYQYSKEIGEIEVSLEAAGENIRFTVKDQGIGIGERELPLIWNRFYRGDKSRTVNKNNSIGLGLSMVKWIADCHSGTVCVTSKVNEGSEFSFIFPVNL